MKESFAGPSLSPIITLLFALGIVTDLVIVGTVAMGTIVDNLLQQCGCDRSRGGG